MSWILLSAFYRGESRSLDMFSYSPKFCHSESVAEQEFEPGHLSTKEPTMEPWKAGVPEGTECMET